MARIATTILFFILTITTRAQVVMMPSMYGVQCRTAAPPVMGPLTLTTVEGTSATLSYSIASLSGSALTARGLVWSTSTGPTTAGLGTVITSGAANTPYTGVISLPNANFYYVRAYATNGNGTAYSNEIGVDLKDFLAVAPWGNANLVTQASIQSWFDSNKLSGTTSPATNSPGAYPWAVPSSVVGYCLYLSDNYWYYKSGDPNVASTWTNMTLFGTGSKGDFSAPISYIRMKRQ